VGERLRLAGPYGRFFVRRSAQRPLVLHGGGSGLSSPRSMILDLLDGGCTLPIALVYGQRVARRAVLRRRVPRAGREGTRHFTYVPALSGEPRGSGWTARAASCTRRRRRISVAASRDSRLTCAGHRAMVEACIATLMQGRLFERDIFTEKFLSAADAQAERSPLFQRLCSIQGLILDTVPRWPCCVAQTGETYACATDESLLRGMLRLGRKGIRRAASTAAAGVCKVRIVEGRVHALGPVSRAHVSADEECTGAHAGLPCRARPAR
jgi:NAD(P)H-flavin reductase